MKEKHVTHTIINADCLDALRDLPDNSVHAVVTDPPYGLSKTDPKHVAETITRWAAGDREYIPTGKGFMNAPWDAFVPPVAVWDECLRVLKPGGHMLVFAGSRTADLMGVSIRLAGFDIRDSISWLYGTGFPKSHNVSKAIDKMAGNERKSGYPPNSLNKLYGSRGIGGRRTSADDPAVSDAAREWEGWGTVLKPAQEPILVARKPFKGTVASNVQEHGTGAINIDACRIPTDDNLQARNTGASLFGGFPTVELLREAAERGEKCPNGSDAKKDYERFLKNKDRILGTPPGKGRFPANVILDEHAAKEVDQQSGYSKDGRGCNDGPRKTKATSLYESTWKNRGEAIAYGGEGGASRFFYVAKASPRERPNVNGVIHPTVKPLKLMEHLVKLVTPPGGVVLDPFAGSGTTIEAAINNGFEVIGIEREQGYLPLIQARIDRANEKGNNDE